MDIFHYLTILEKESAFDPKIIDNLKRFFKTYLLALEKSNTSIESVSPALQTFLQGVQQHLKKPFIFKPHHKAFVEPVDYYQMGLEIFRPLIDFSNSLLIGLKNVEKMHEQWKKGDNVILLANHQTEADPQIISLLLEKEYPNFAFQLTFVAGHRVTTDPLAVPLSLGRNLLCIYSKKHINHPPEKRLEKQLHNQKTMKIMKNLLSQGKQFIYVAPSGGRDRINSQGFIPIQDFDPQALQMFYLMAKASGKTTHFYPLALYTYDILPPPNVVNKELGERRLAQYGPVLMNFGNEFDMENFPGCEEKDKKIRRKKRASYLTEIVKKLYKKKDRMFS